MLIWTKVVNSVNRAKQAWSDTQCWDIRDPWLSPQSGQRSLSLAPMLIRTHTHPDPCQVQGAFADLTRNLNKSTWGFLIFPGVSTKEVVQKKRCWNSDQSALCPLSGAALLVVMVTNADQAEGVLFGEKGAAGALAEGAAVVLCSTVPPDFVRGLEKRLSSKTSCKIGALLKHSVAKQAPSDLRLRFWWRFC